MPVPTPGSSFGRHKQAQHLLPSGHTSVEMAEVPFGTIRRLEVEDMESTMSTQEKWVAAEAESGGTLISFPSMPLSHRIYRIRVWWHA